MDGYGAGWTCDPGGGTGAIWYIFPGLGRETGMKAVTQKTKRLRLLQKRNKRCKRCVLRVPTPPAFFGLRLSEETCSESDRVFCHRENDLREVFLRITSPRQPFTMAETRYASKSSRRLGRVRRLVEVDEARNYAFCQPDSRELTGMLPDLAFLDKLFTSAHCTNTLVPNRQAL